MKKRYHTTINDGVRARELARAAGFANPDAIDKEHPASRAAPIWMRFLEEAKRLNDEDKQKGK